MLQLNLTFIRKHLSIFIAFILCMFLASCGGNTSNNNQASWSPVITFDYPIKGSSENALSQSMVYGNSIDLRGFVKDPNGSEVASLSVVLLDGRKIKAELSPIDASNISLGMNWRAPNVSLEQKNSMGFIPLFLHIVNEQDVLAVYPLDEALISRDISLITPVYMDSIPNTNRVVVVDYYHQSLIEVNVDTGEQKILSNKNIGSGPNFIEPASVVVNSAGNKAYLTDINDGILFKVNLLTGDRTIISNNTLSAGDDLEFPYGIILLESSNQAIILDQHLPGVYSINLNTGEKTLISNNTVGTGPKIDYPRGIAYDPSSPNRLLVTNTARDEEGLFAIDIATGNRSIISSADQGNGNLLDNPGLTYIDATNNTAFVLNNIAFNSPNPNPSIIEVDLETGDQKTVSNRFSISDFTLVNLNGITFNNSKETLYIADSYSGVITDVDKENGSRNLVYGQQLGEGPRPFLAMQSGSNNIYVQANIPDTTNQAVFHIDLMTGDRTPIIESAQSEYSFYFRYAHLAHDSINNRLIATVDNHPDFELVAIDLDTSQEMTLSSETIGTGPEFLNGSALCIDATQAKAYARNNTGSIIEINLNTGNRTLIFDNASSNETLNSDLDSCEIDRVNQTLYALYRFGMEIEIYSIDLQTKAREVISSHARGNGIKLENPIALSLDIENNIVLIIDDELKAVVAVNLSSGDRTIIADKETGNGPAIKLPTSITIDKQKQVAYIGAFDSVFMLNLSGNCMNDNDADGYADIGCSRVVISQ